MKIDEALQWLDGNRSWVNDVPSEPRETWLVRIEQADAACMQKAYWVVKAHREFNQDKLLSLIDQIEDTKWGYDGDCGVNELAGQIHDILTGN